MATINISTMITTTTTTTPIGTNFTRYYDQFQVIHGILIKISFPYIFLIAFIGLITNTSTVILLSKNNVTKNLKNKWTLIALALSDLLFNTALLVRGLHDVIKGGSDRLCVIISFLSHLAELLSACYTVSFTIQRYSAVRYPFEAAVRRRSSPIISLLCILVLSSLFCFFLAHRNRYTQCQEELDLRWFIADALLSFVIPFSLILIFNILIVNYIRKHSCSPISVQSTLRRKNHFLKHHHKTSYPDETFETEYNPVTNITALYIQSDGNETVEIKYHREKKSSPEREHQFYQPVISSLLHRTSSEIASNHRQSNFVFRSLDSSKRNSYRKKKFSTDSNRTSNKSSCQSNEHELTARISMKTSQSIRVTRMLVLVSTCFLILNAPAHICVIVLKIYTSFQGSLPDGHSLIDHDKPMEILPVNSNRTHNETLSSSLLLEAIGDDKLAFHLLYMSVLATQLVAYASYSINFFLYSFSGIAFRTSLRQLINKFRRH